MASCASAIVSLLKGYGVDTVFGIPGVHTIELYRALPGSGIRHVTPRHEQGAAFMADGYARSTGRPGVCILISGPGLTNAATPIAQAYSDSMPLLIISAVHRRKDIGLGRGYLHELKGQRELMAQITASSHTLLDTANLREVLGRAFAVFGAGRPRPVHIEVPIDLMDAEYTGSLLPLAIPARAAPDLAAVAAAAEILSQAKRPLVIAGGGASGAAAEMIETIRRLDAPIILTSAAKGVVPADHPLNLGATIRRKEVRKLIADADAVLAVGTELGETDRWAGGEVLESSGHLVRIDVDAEQIVRQANTSIGIVSDAKAALASLNRALADQPPQHDRTLGSQRVATLRANIDPDWRADVALHKRLMATLAQSFPADAIVAADSTQIIYTGVQDFPSMLPRSWITSTTGFGTLGFALPAAIGAKLANPNRPVACIIGDGGLLFTLSELATAVEEKTGFPIIVWNNGGYGEIAAYMDSAKVARCGVDLYVPDLCMIAQGFGCRSDRPASLEALRRTILESFRAQVPTLIEIRSDAPFLQ